ncbi:Adenine specific DNA methyltransferase (fragment) [Nitrolancea hollandica Lb]|uniref:Adenine specific DNA methyltransferase n=1 Tax=Nitrolancea hollandica Lb TaxID=1129897 RepID=I4ED96_9BACT
MPLSETRNERVAVYLTNALTGWGADNPDETTPIQTILRGYPQLLEERDQAREVKRDKPILVILGNPPYNGFAGVAVDEERDLTDAYRVARATKQPQGQGLNDLYVRFFRMAERRIVEQTGKGIVCFISNYSWLDGLSFTAMRERYLEVFDRIWIDNLHGDRIISEYAPDGRTSETVFATRGASPGIKVGTSIALMVRTTVGERRGNGLLCYRDMDQAQADERRAALIASLGNADFDASHIQVAPNVELGLPFKPRRVGDDYLSWPLLPDLFPWSSPGIQPSRDDVVVDIDRDRLVRRMEQYFDPDVSHAEMRRIVPGAMESTARFQAEAVRDALLHRGFLPDKIVRYCYRPFDVRWLYWEPETKLLDEKRADYFPQVFEGNLFLAAAQRNRKNFDPPFPVSRHGSRHIIERGANLFPLLLRSVEQIEMFPGSDGASDGATSGQRFNLSELARAYVGGFGSADHAHALFFHTLAVLHSPAYRQENEGALRQDWPRIPLPDSKDALLASAGLGREIASLLDTERPVTGVTQGAIRPEFKVIGPIAHVAGGVLNPDAGDLDVTVGWGHRGRGGITMPGRGMLIERDYTTGERAAIEAGATTLGLSPGEAFALLGETTCDVYLNDRAYWRNVPARVWGYTIGGYQVMKKWLSYRETALLGRSLRPEEAREVTDMARRIAAILLLEPRLDANYQAVKVVRERRPPPLTPPPILGEGN